MDCDTDACAMRPRRFAAGSPPYDVILTSPNLPRGCSKADLPWEYTAATGLLAIDVRPAGDEPLVTIAW
jgi:hypothetical protein